jgi:hypothetical protein
MHGPWDDAGSRRGSAARRAMSVSPLRRIGYVGNAVRLPSEAEGAKGGAELETLRTASTCVRLTASSEESPRGPTFPASRWRGGVGGRCECKPSHAVAILAA